MQKPNLTSDILVVPTEHKATIFTLASLVQPTTSGTALARHIISLGLAEYLRQNPKLELRLADLQYDQANQSAQAVG